MNLKSDIGTNITQNKVERFSQEFLIKKKR